MTTKLQPVRGTHDIFKEEYDQFAFVEKTAVKIAALYGFSPLKTPIFEFTEVFKRTLGEDSDIVGKEMYSFTDKGGENITLRPEFTAQIARAFIHNGWQQQLPLKIFTTGPLFRYERPQKGRMRQFHQINFEILGAAEYLADVEAIALGNHIITTLGIADKIELEINSLGDDATRQNYRKALIEYFTKFKSELSEDSLRRLALNPMRILDSKDAHDREIVQNAPKMGEFYSAEAKQFFDNVKNGLSDLGINYKVNDRLVRGLDYYCHTAFEFTTSHLGAQNAVLAGGRYDGLIERMGGLSTPAIGFAGGIERLVALLNNKPVTTSKIAVIPIGEAAEKEAFVLVDILRKANLAIHFSYSGNVKKRFKKADGDNVAVAVVFGDTEIANKTVKIKDFRTGEETEITTARLIDYLAEKLQVKI